MFLNPAAGRAAVVKPTGNLFVNTVVELCAMKSGVLLVIRLFSTPIG